MTFKDVIEDIVFPFFYSREWGDIVAVLMPLCFIAIVIFLLMIFWSLSKSSWIYWYVIADAKDFRQGSPVPLEKKAQKRWKKIKEKLLSKKEGQWKLAIIEASDIVEDILANIGYPGKDMARRLEKATEAQIPNLKDLFGAAEIQSNIIADPDFALKRKKAVEAINILEDFLKHLNYL